MVHSWRWLSAVALFAVTGSANAAVPIQIEFDEGIAIADKAEVRALVDLDLRGAARQVTKDGAIVVHLHTVAGSTRVRIDVDDDVTGKTVGRTVDIFALGQVAAPRLLSVAIVELVTASWAELLTNPAPVVTPVGEPPSPEIRRDAIATMQTRDQHGMQISAFGTTHGPFDGTGFLFGGGVRVVPPLSHTLVLPIDITYERGTRKFSLGTIAAESISADVSIAYQRIWTRWGLRAGVGARAGTVRYAGTAEQDAVGHVVWAPWGGPVASVSALALMSHALLVELMIDGGYATTGTRSGVEQGPEVALAGPWVGISLAFGLEVEH